MAIADSGGTTRRRRRWPWILVILVILVAGLGGVEWWARGMNLQAPSWHGPEEEEPGLMTGHPTRLWGMTPGERVNGQTTASINKHGIRGDAPEIPRPQGRHRIITLGDSSFFGFLVSDQEVFTAQLQTYLRDKGVDVEVLNAGVAGYSIAQHTAFMEEVGWDLEPTLIVYCNLWSDNTWDTFRDEDLLVSRRFAQYNPLVHSAAMRLLASKLSKPEDDLAGRVIMWSEDNGWPEGKVRRVPLARFIKLHDEMIRKAASRGIGGAFMIPTNSSLISDHDAPPGTSAWDPYFKAFRVLSAHNSMPIINLTEVFEEGLKSGLDVEDLVLDLMHPSPEGHRLIAEALGDALLEAGWPDTPLVGSTEEVDGSKVRDIPGMRWTNDAGAGSPQRLLFDISETEEAAIAERAAARAEEGPGPEGEIDPATGKVPLTPPPTGNWQADITVKGGTPPYKVVIRTTEGKPGSSARLLKPMAIGLMVRGEMEEGVVEVTDATGAVVTADISKSEPRVILSLSGG